MSNKKKKKHQTASNNTSQIFLVQTDGNANGVNTSNGFTAGKTDAIVRSISGDKDQIFAIEPPTDGKISNDQIDKLATLFNIWRSGLSKDQMAILTANSCNKTNSLEITPDSSAPADQQGIDEVTVRNWAAAFNNIASTTSQPAPAPQPKPAQPAKPAPAPQPQPAPTKPAPAPQPKPAQPTKPAPAPQPKPAQPTKPATKWDFAKSVNENVDALWGDDPDLA